MFDPPAVEFFFHRPFIDSQDYEAKSEYWKVIVAKSNSMAVI